MAKKIKVLMLGDIIFSHSGVGIQLKYISDFLLRSGKFQIVQLGGALKHPSYQPLQTQEYGNDLTVYPVNGFGTKDMVRSFIHQFKPDILLMMSDPRFYMWLFEMENEIRTAMPIVYYNIWDAPPAPTYNFPYYMSCDKLICISKLTKQLVEQVIPNRLEDISYLPHTCREEIYRPIPKDIAMDFRKKTLPQAEGKVLFFYNGRNARRKQTASMIFWFKEFLDKVGKDKASLLMHTEVFDENGSNLEEIIRHLGLIHGEVMFSQEKIPQEGLALLYNAADVTLSISEAEGFGVCNYVKSLLFTNKGTKCLGDVEKNDYVLSEDGKFHRVLALGEKHYDDVLKIKTVGNSNDELILTKEHKVLCYKQKNLSNNIRANNFKNKNFLCESKEEDIKLEWIKAKDISENDWLVMPKLKDVEVLQKNIDLSSWIDNKKGNNCYDSKHIWRKKNGKKINRFIEVDEKFLNIVGWFLAEGSTGKCSEVNFCFNSKEIDIAERLGKDIKNIFGVNYSVKESIKRKNRCHLRIGSGILGEFFNKLCGPNAHNKFIHSIFMKNPSRLGPLLNGLFCGDGNYEKYYESMRLTSVCKSLLWQVKMILSNQGIYSSIVEEDNSQGFGDGNIYKLKIGVKNFSEFCHYIGIEEKYKNSIRIERKKAKERRWIIKDNYILLPVRRIENMNDKMEVMDIQVEDSKTFVSNGIVIHNCTLESLFCGTPIIVNMTGGLQEQVTDGKEFFGVGIEPKCKMIAGSQQIPFINEERILKEDFIAALEKMFYMTSEERQELGMKGREYVLANYGFEQFGKKWVETMEKIHGECGSWGNRKNYKSFNFKKI